ncbi:MAG: gliding motility-associated-like protein [Crocinitomix sp.]
MFTQRQQRRTIMNKFKTLWQSALLIIAAFGINGTAIAQCDFTGLSDTYCEGDEHATLIGDPLGGIFSGPGITGDTFDPSIAGPGIHTITYELAGGGTGDAFYLKAAAGEPWGGPANPNSMDLAFGVGLWTIGNYETVDPAVVFAPTTGFVFMDGGSMHASELEAFLVANLATMEAWVTAGGRLLLNSAPNEGGDINFGFDGTTMEYDGSSTYASSVTVIDPAHPAQLGPELPASIAMTGTYYGHGLIIGVGYTDVIFGDGDASRIVLAEKCWGSGRVMMGGMTTDNFHDPDPDAQNWRANLYTYMYNNACGGGCTVTKEVEVFADPDVTLTVAPTVICEGEEVTFTAGGADSYVFFPLGPTSGTAYTVPDVGTTTYTVTGTDATSGCTNTASVDVLVNPLPDVTASTDDDEVCFGDPMTLSGGGAATYVWTGGAIDGVPFTPGPIGPITYTVTGTSAEGCVSTAVITIEVIDCEPVFAGFFFDDNICVGDCITLTDTSVGSTIQSWDWDFGGAVDPNTSTELNPRICFTTVGEFNISLTITSLYGQVSTATHTLTVNALPIMSTKLDTIIDLGGQADLIATSISEGIYTWTPENGIDCADCPITWASPTDSTTYNVVLIDENGCKTEGDVLVLVNFVKGVGVPTAFSPNGDGSNDVLYVKGLGLAAVSLVVYNRYGEVVFETDDQEVGWDGMFKGKMENPGVFTWVLHYDFITGDKGYQDGNTTLMR